MPFGKFRKRKKSGSFRKRSKRAFKTNKRINYSKQVKRLGVLRILLLFLILLVLIAGISVPLVNYFIIHNNNPYAEESNGEYFSEEQQQQLLQTVNRNSPLEKDYIPMLTQVKGVSVNALMKDDLEELLTAAENDGIGKETLITKLIEKRLNTTVWNAIDDIYDKGQSYVASFTNEVFEAFKAGDKAAYEIIEKNMKVLTEQINFAAEKYDCGKEVIFSGGIMKESDILQEFINRTLNKDLKIVVSDTPQIYGACVLCNKMFGEEKKDFKENFAADYKRFIGG